MQSAHFATVSGSVDYSRRLPPPYESIPAITNCTTEMKPSAAIFVSVSMWFVNRMSMNVKIAFSSFCRFYASFVLSATTSTWSRGTCSTIVMLASSELSRQLSLYSWNTPKGTYFPAGVETALDAYSAPCSSPAATDGCSGRPTPRSAPGEEEKKRTTRFG